MSVVEISTKGNNSNLELNEDDLNNTELNENKSTMGNLYKIPKNKYKAQKCDKVTNDSLTYIVTLSFLNELVVAYGKTPITEIIQFKLVSRDDILKPISTEILNNHLDIFVKTFGKSKLRYNERLDHVSYVLTIIKCLTKFCGYDLLSHSRRRFIKTDSNFYIYQEIRYYRIE